MCLVYLIQQHSVCPKSCPNMIVFVGQHPADINNWNPSMGTFLKSNTEFLGSFSMLGLSQVVGTEASSNLIAYDVFACFAKTAVVQVVVFQRPNCTFI